MSTTKGQQLIGTKLGPYVLEEVLGHGGSSAVFLAQAQQPAPEEVSKRSTVAIKVFQPRSTLDAKMQREFYKRFLREAEAASKLDHPHILPLYSYSTQDGLPYIVMPYVQGGTLQDYVSRNGPLSLEEAQTYLAEVASALDYAHEQGCVHCDVKPANLLLDGEGHVLLTDFGIARTMQLPSTTDRPDVEAGQDAKAKPRETLMGTPDYISPEQALGQPLDGRSDVYSLAVTLFFLLAGHPPFRENSTIAVALRHVHEPPPALGLLRAEVSPEIDQVMQKALAKLPEERFQTAGKFSAAFASAIELTMQSAITASRLGTVRTGQTVPSNRNGAGPIIVSHTRVPVKPRWLQPSGRLRLLLTAAIVLVILLGVVLTAGWIISQNTGSARGTGPTSTATVPVGTVTSTVPIDSLSDTQDWLTSQTTSSNFFFMAREYHIRNSSGQKVAQALYAEHQYGNIHLTVTVSEVHGSHDGADFYGIILHSNVEQTHYYLFEVTAWNGGQYGFLRYDGQWKELATGPVPSLLTAANKSNTITIDAIGNTFRFFVNGKAVGKAITDRSAGALLSGEIGLYVEEQGAEVAFSRLYIRAVGS